MQTTKISNRVKLIYIANARIPTEKAHGIQIMKMCEAFANAGADVNLVSPWRFNFIKDDPFKYYGIKENFKITKVPSLDLVKAGKIGFWIQSLSFACASFWYVLPKKADIIYSRDELPLLFLSFLKENIFWETHIPKWNFISKRIFKKCPKIIAITRGLKDFYAQKGVSPENVLVAPDGVDVNEFKVKGEKLKIREKLRLPIDKKIILYAGHLYGWKGAQTLADAVRFWGKGILAVFAGGTDEDIREFRKLNKEKESVLVLGRKSHAEIPYYLKSADVLVLPNRSDNEISQKYTSPMKLFEYMASGTPIVASDLSSIREILNESNAVLVEPDNSEALAEGVKKILNNKEFSDKISKQAFADVQNYTWEKRAERTIEFIKLKS